MSLPALCAEITPEVGAILLVNLALSLKIAASIYLNRKDIVMHVLVQQYSFVPAYVLSHVIYIFILVIILKRDVLLTK